MVLFPFLAALLVPIHDCRRDTSQAGNRYSVRFRQDDVVRRCPKREPRVAAGADRVNVRRAVVVEVDHDPIWPDLKQRWHNNLAARFFATCPSRQGLVQQLQPDEIYNLAAQSHVAVSFEEPEYTANSDALGALRVLNESE